MTRLQAGYTVAMLRSLGGVVVRATRSQSALAAQPQPRATSVLHAPPTSIATLENGVKVATENLGGNVATVGILVDVGARNERDSHNESGATRMMQQMLFSGTESKSRDEVCSALSSISPSVETSADRESLAVYATCQPEDVEKTIALLSECVQRPNFSSQAIDDARRAVLTELKEHEDDPVSILDHYLHAQAYMQTPLAMPITGRVKTVQSMGADTLRQFHANNFQGSRITVAAAGNVNPERVAEAARSHFGAARNEFPDEISDDFRTCRYTGSYVYHREDSWPLCYGMIAMEAPGWDNIVDHATMLVAKEIMGSYNRAAEPWETSPYRLVQRIGHFGYTSVYDAFYHPYYGTGLWGTYFAVQDVKTEDFTTEMMREWRYLASLCSEQDAEAGRNALKARLFSSLQSSTTCAKAIAKQAQRHGRTLVHELPSIIDSIDVDRLKTTCHKYLYERDPVVIGFGRCGKLQFDSYWTVKYKTYGWAL